MNELELYQNIIDLFKSSGFSVDEEKETNIFEVTGYPHYENVASNVLRFFFDTSEEHNFNDLWLRSLLEAYNSISKEKVNFSLLETKNIEREYSNGTEKRIDILIDARPLLIVIENKIEAGINNPFNIYTEMTENYAKDNNVGSYKMVKIILSVNEEKQKESDGFVNVTYDELFKKMDKLWPNYEPTKKWELFAIDFINNLRRRKEDTNMKMEKEWLDFVESNGETLTALLNKLENSINERVSICRTINESLQEIAHTKGVYNSVNATYVSQFITIKMKDGFNVCLETYAMKTATKKEFEDYDKLYVSLWCRANKNYNFDYILTALEKKDAKMRITTGSGAWGKHYILNEILLTDTFNLEKISSTIKEYVEKIDALNKE